MYFSLDSFLTLGSGFNLYIFHVYLLFPEDEPVTHFGSKPHIFFSKKRYMFDVYLLFAEDETNNPFQRQHASFFSKKRLLSTTTYYGIYMDTVVKHITKKHQDPCCRHHGFVPWDGDADVCVTRLSTPQKMVRFSAGSKLRKTWEFPGEWKASFYLV